MGAQRYNDYRHNQSVADEAKKAAFKQGLDEELRLKQERTLHERTEAYHRDTLPEYDPWGKDGSGAPMRDLRGNVLADAPGSDIRAGNQPQAGIGYADHTGCYTDRAGCHQLVPSTARPTRVEPLPGGVRLVTRTWTIALPYRLSSIGCVLTHTQYVTW
jgi:hypothetical protein